MKFRYLTYAGFLAVVLFVLTGCKPQRGKALSDYSNLTTGDSLMYYYAQMRAIDYWDEARNDTSLRSVEERRKYLDGVIAGMKAIRKGEKNDIYNQGVRAGARMAMRFIDFENTYNVDLEDEILINSLMRGLESPDNEIPWDECQETFYRLLGEVKEKRREEISKDAQQTLVAVARKNNLSKIQPDLYYRIEKKGFGPYAKAGDAIFITVDYSLDDGEDIGMPPTERIVVGASGVPQVLDNAYMRLNKGSVAMFATTAQAVFGSRTDIMDLNPDDVLIIRITLNDIIPANGI